MFVKYEDLCSEFRSEYEGSTYRSDLGKFDHDHSLFSGTLGIHGLV